MTPSHFTGVLLSVAASPEDLLVARCGLHHAGAYRHLHLPVWRLPWILEKLHWFHRGTVSSFTKVWDLLMWINANLCIIKIYTERWRDEGVMVIPSCPQAGSNRSGDVCSVRTLHQYSHPWLLPAGLYFAAALFPQTLHENHWPGARYTNIQVTTKTHHTYITVFLILLVNKHSYLFIRFFYLKLQ